MAFTPKLEMCLKTCSLIKFVDTTNVYNATTNTGGWENAVAGSDVDTAVITVTDSDGTTQLTYDVSSQIPSTVTGDISFTDSETSLSDGDYDVVYTITLTNNAIYTYKFSTVITCNFEACIDELLATIPEKYCDDRCDTSYIDDFLIIEGLLYAYKAAKGCDKPTIKADIEKRLTRFCDFTYNC